MLFRHSASSGKRPYTGIILNCKREKMRCAARWRRREVVLDGPTCAEILESSPLKPVRVSFHAFVPSARSAHCLFILLSEFRGACRPKHTALTQPGFRS